ncbi:MAG: hypothetical protein ACM33T_04400 [Solirubrobacterales bacterium]
MFGTQKTPSEKKPDPAIERAKQECKDQLLRMHDAGPDEAERIAKHLKDRCGSDKQLPFDFKKKLLERARFHECNANMRAANKALHEALRMAADEQMALRSQKLAEGRRYCAKACALGADADFRAAAQRLIDNVMMTGGIQHKGPTRAKPAETAPRAPRAT